MTNTNLSYIWKGSYLMSHFEPGSLALPVHKILWAPSNSAHHNHLHVEGYAPIDGTLRDCTSIRTKSLNTIIQALVAEFGDYTHFQVNTPGAGWKHMGIYNCRNIAGTNTPSQHAFSNAIDIGPYYGVKEQQKFYDFLTKEEDMVTRNDKADNGSPTLKPDFDKMVSQGVMSVHTQPGGVAFNDEIAAFMGRLQSDILAVVERRVQDALKVVQQNSGGLTRADVEAIVESARLEVS